MTIWVQETHVNVTENYIIEESSKYECGDASYETILEAFIGEYGDNYTSQYYESTDGKVIANGWVFTQEIEYEDSPETFERETWVGLYEAPDKVVTTEYPLEVPEVEHV